MRRAGFPFAAVCGMEDVKKALLLCLVNPLAGGLLISGTRGTAKSTVARSAAELTQRPWAEVPVSITEDRLFGCLDAQETLKSGARRLLPGVLARSDGGIVYMDDVNLLRDEVLAAVLNIKEAGGYTLEREGFSEKIATSFTPLAVMDPASGTLSAANLDRFGLFVHVEEEKDLAKRGEIARRVLEFEKDPAAFRAAWQQKTDETKDLIQKAEKALPDIAVSDAMLQLACVYTLKARVAGHRADICLIEAARAVAALSGRSYVLPKDLEEAARFVLPHRMRQTPEDKAAQPEDAQQNEKEAGKSNEEDRQEPKDADEELFCAPDTPDIDTLSTEDRGGRDEDRSEDARMENPGTKSRERTDAADLTVKLPPIWIEPSHDKKPKKGTGKRSLTRTDLKQGRYVRPQIPSGKPSDIAFDATLRAAAPYQRLRKAEGRALVIEKDDIRTKVREKRTGNIFLFVVDASGSMGARERMKTVKGVIFRILMEAYQKRDKVGMVAFRKNRAEVLLPVTRSVDFAQKKLALMPTGGKTPLALGLSRTEDLLDMMYRQDPTQDPVVVLITDGRATNPLSPGGNAVADALEEARRIGRRKLLTCVIDTESGFIRLGLAKKIAREMGSAYFRVDRLSEDNLMQIWRSAIDR